MIFKESAAIVMKWVMFKYKKVECAKQSSGVTITIT